VGTPNVTERFRRCSSHVRLTGLQLFRQRCNGLAVLPIANRVDDADQDPPLGLAKSGPQRLVSRRIWDGLQGNPGPGRQFWVEHKGRQCWNGRLGTVDNQALASNSLFGRRRFRFENSDELLFFLSRTCLRGRGSGKAGGKSQSGQDREVQNGILKIHRTVEWRVKRSIASYKRQGSRRASERSRLASSSPMNSFFLGSNLTLRPRKSATLAA